MIQIDLHEPFQIYQLLTQVVEAKYLPLNPEYADYLWNGIDGTVEWERKTWAELLSDLDGVEAQLRRERQAHPQHRFGLIVEGIATPSIAGTSTWRQGGKDRNIFYRSKEYHLSIKAVYAWLYQVEKYMEVYFTASREATAYALVSFYQADQKEGHTTFQRHLNTMTFSSNPQVEMLMAIGKGVGIGPAKSEELVRQFGTVWNILSSPPEKLQGVGRLGKSTIEKLLR